MRDVEDDSLRRGKLSNWIKEVANVEDSDRSCLFCCQWPNELGELRNRITSCNGDSSSQRIYLADSQIRSKTFSELAFAFPGLPEEFSTIAVSSILASFVDIN
ncbi:hypothetical protein HN011_000188 [Eciton burchellii]|nr:hypothetical protein HN011_000188 [Eciton burchellii]